MLVLLVWCKEEEEPNIVLEHWAVCVIQSFDFLYKIKTQVSWTLCWSNCKILRKLPSMNSWISAGNSAMDESAIRTPFWKLSSMSSRAKPLVRSLLGIRHTGIKNMASNIATVVGLVLVLFCPLCLAKVKTVKTFTTKPNPQVIPPTQQLRNENWDRMLKGEWMVKL